MLSEVRSYLDYLSFERGLAFQTCSAYETDLESFMVFLKDEKDMSEDVSCEALSVDCFLEYQAFCTKQGLSEATIARRMVALKGFMDYCVSEGLVKSNPLELISSRHVTKTLPHSLNGSEITALLSCASSLSEESHINLRNKAIMELLYSCGLRVSELVSLTLQSISFEDASIKCVGKGNKTRYIPLGQYASDALKNYLQEGRYCFSPEERNSYIFLGIKGKQITRNAVWHIVKECTQKAGLTGAVSPHWLRHTFATHLLENEAPIRVIQELLGHANIATTQVYTHVNVKQLKNIHKRFHPRG